MHGFIERIKFYFPTTLNEGMKIIFLFTYKQGQMIEGRINGCADGLSGRTKVFYGPLPSWQWRIPWMRMNIWNIHKMKYVHGISQRYGRTDGETDRQMSDVCVCVCDKQEILQKLRQDFLKTSLKKTRAKFSFNIRLPVSRFYILFCCKYF